MAKVAVRRGWGCALCGRLEGEKEPAMDVRLYVEVERGETVVTFHVCETCAAYVDEHGEEGLERLGGRLRKLLESAVEWAVWTGQRSPYWEWEVSA